MTSNGHETVLARALAAAGGPAWAQARTLHARGRVRAGGLEGPCEHWVELDGGRFALAMTLGPATLASGHDGVQGWQRGANGEVVLQDSDAGRRLARTDAWIQSRGWWFAGRGAAIESLGRREDAGAAFDVLRAVPAGGQAVELWFDATTHRLARLVQEVLGRPSVRRFDDWRVVDGLLLPFRQASGHGDPRFDRVTEFDAIAVGAAPPAGAFEAPAQVFADVAFLHGGTRAEVGIEIVNNHVFVAVEIDGHALRFLLDTGGVNLVAAATARRIGLEGVGALEARGPGAAAMGSGFARVARLVVAGAVALERQLVRVLDMPGFDEIEGVAVDGVLGVELFKRLAVQVDYPRATLTLARSADFVPPAGAHALPLTFFGHFPAVAGELDGVAGQFWLDTGNRGGVVLLAPFVERHGLADRYATTAPTPIGWGVGGRVDGRLARGGRLSLGVVEVRAPVLRLPLAHDGALAVRDVAGNVGGEVLRRFVVAFDYARRTVHLRPDADASRPFDADRAGVWINAHPHGTMGGAVVGAVMAGGPAEAAGLRVDDVVTTVDGVPALARGLDGLRRQLAESPAGRRLLLGVRRGAAETEAALVLRDLV